MKEVCQLCKNPVASSEDAAVCQNPKCEKYQQTVLIELIEDDSK